MHGREEVDRVGGEDRADCALPAGLDGGLETSTVTQLVPDSLEVDDEGVRGNTDGHDETRDTGERQAVALAPGQDRDDQVGDQSPR